MERYILISDYHQRKNNNHIFYDKKVITDKHCRNPWTSLIINQNGDSYICSSNWMRDAYRRRPNDFKRRILKRNIIKTELLTEEHKWLSMILDEELGKKYYNLHKHHFGHWSNNEEMKRTIGQKISSSPYRAIRIGLANKGKKPAQKTLDANIQKLKGKSYEEIHGPEKAAIIKEKISNAGKGKKHNDAARKKMSEKAKTTHGV